MFPCGRISPHKLDKYQAYGEHVAGKDSEIERLRARSAQCEQPLSESLRLGEPLLKAIWRKASVIRVAGTRQRAKFPFGGRSDILCHDLPGFVKIVAKVLPRLAFRRIPAVLNAVSTLCIIPYAFRWNDIRDCNVGYDGLTLDEANFTFDLENFPSTKR